MKLLDPYTFYFELPIYTPINITQENYQDFISLLYFNETIDGYHPRLKENTTYSVSSCYSMRADHFQNEGGFNSCIIKCLRTDDEFKYYILYNRNTETFMKIGQYPSIADFHISKIKKYDKVLNKNELKEFSKAIGLAANGVGIGSFVYLRRIFENLIEEAHKKAKVSSGWNDETYNKQRMAERIEMLKDYLPEFLVDNKSLYSILSVGIHSLDEQECLAYFETVKVGIELILDEKVEQYKKQKKIEEAKQKLSLLTQQVKKN